MTIQNFVKGNYLHQFAMYKFVNKKKTCLITSRSIELSLGIIQVMFGEVFSVLNLW